MIEDLFGWQEPPRYPQVPAEGRTDTSAAAAVKSDRKTIRVRVLASLTRDGPATSTELSERLAIIFEDVQPRTSELRAQGLIEDSGERRPTKYGNSSIVWRAVRGAL